VQECFNKKNIFPTFCTIKATFGTIFIASQMFPFRLKGFVKRRERMGNAVETIKRPAVSVGKGFF